MARRQLRPRSSRAVKANVRGWVAKQINIHREQAMQAEGELRLDERIDASSP